MIKVTLALIFDLLAACSGNDPTPPLKAEPMLHGVCVNRIIPNIFGPDGISYQECRWRGRIWACLLTIDGYYAGQIWRCEAVTQTVPAAPADPAPTDPTS